jgi:hypothetical protein
MARQNTQLESEGAEFLVLGQLLVQGIPSFKAYQGFAGYDLVATNPGTNRAARLQVKSRWRTGAEGFIIKRFDCDFVVVVLLNRGSKDGAGVVKPPQFFVVPVKVIEAAAGASKSNWGKISWKQIEGFKDYEDRWHLVEDFLANSGGEPGSHGLR